MALGFAIVLFAGIAVGTWLGWHLKKEDLAKSFCHKCAQKIEETK
jgi:hypothetical protein